MQFWKGGGAEIVVDGSSLIEKRNRGIYVGISQSAAANNDTVIIPYDNVEIRNMRANEKANEWQVSIVNNWCSST